MTGASPTPAGNNVNRDQVSFHGLWTFNPDGANQMVLLNNLGLGDTFHADPKPIPGTDLIASIASPKHGRNEKRGRIIIQDTAFGPSDPRGLRLIDRGYALPRTNEKKTSHLDLESWRDPFPISRNYFLAATLDRIVVMNAEGDYEIIHQLPGEYDEDLFLHEHRTHAPAQSFHGDTLKALGRPPAKVEPVPGVPQVIHYMKDIQPVWNEHCLDCHNNEKYAGGWYNIDQPDLSLLLTAPLAKEAGGTGFCKQARPKRMQAGLDEPPATIFTSKDDPDYQILREQVMAVVEEYGQPRYWQENFQPTPEYIRELKRYGALPADFAAGKDDFDPWQADLEYFKVIYQAGPKPEPDLNLRDPR